MLEFHLSTIIFTIINLLVLYVILRKVLFGKVNAVLEQRAQLVQQEIDAAQAGNRQAQELKAQYEGQLQDAHQRSAGPAAQSGQGLGQHIEKHHEGAHR